MSMSYKLHPLALEFLNTHINYVEIVLAPPPLLKKNPYGVCCFT